MRARSNPVWALGRYKLPRDDEHGDDEWRVGSSNPQVHLPILPAVRRWLSGPGSAVSAPQESPESPSISSPAEGLLASRQRRQEAAVRRRWRRRLGALLAVALLLSPAIYSYTTTMLKPSSLPLWPRSVEWLRAHQGNWLVDEVEHYYYSLKAPSKGGPQLTSLPSVGQPAPKTVPRPTGADRRGRVAPAHQAGLRPSPTRRGRLERDRAPRPRPSARARHHVPHGTRLPADRCLRRVVRSRPHISSRSTPAATNRRARLFAARWRFHSVSDGGCSRRSTAASSTTTATTGRRSTARCTSRSNAVLRR